MRGVRLATTVAVAGVGGWLAGGALGALVALGPLRLAHGERGAVGVGATLVAASLLAFLGVIWWRRTGRGLMRVVGAVVALPLLAIGAMPVAVAVWAAHPTRASSSTERPFGARDIAIPCGDGVTLAAWFLPTHNGAAVVLSHGAGSTRDDVLDQAAVLYDAGYGVLLLDARGHGESGGAAMDLGWWGEEDLTCAVDAVVGLAGVDDDRIALVGLSMGAEESIGAAGVDPRVRAVVAEGATGRTAADKDGWLPTGPLGAIQRAMDGERDALLGLLTDAPRPRTLREAALATDAALLLIAAGTVPSEGEACAWIAEGNPRIEVWEVEGAAHTRALATVPDEWRARVVGFLDDALAG